MKEDVYSYDGRIVTTTITVIYTTNCCGEREREREREKEREREREREREKRPKQPNAWPG